MALDARIEAQRLRSLYEQDPRQNKFSLLLLGEKGVGKTKLLQTARKPVHIDSFDPGGTHTLRKEIIKGDIIADTQWEHEDPLNPTQYKKWKTTFEYRCQSNYFDNFGTYCLDSSTMWAMTIMNQQLKDANALGQSPKWNRDYKPQRTEVENSIKKMLSLPCDTILTGHLAPIYETKRVPDGQGGYDEIQEIGEYGFLTTGQGVVIIPLLFTEMWLAMTKDGPGGPSYYLLTSRKGKYKASTRIGDGKKLKQEEEPDIKAILKKCGLNWQDKAPLYESLPTYKPASTQRANSKTLGENL